MKKTVLTFIASLFLTASCFSMEFKLKDGSIIKGNIVSETNDEITISVTISKSSIESTEFGSFNSNNETYTKPEKREPLMPGNFEVIQGGAVSSPIDCKKLSTIAKSALVSHGYRILKEEPGIITYMLYKNSWDLTMKFCYAEDEYWYEYVSSRNLDANPIENKIHKNYYKWITILERDITQLY